MKRSYPISIKLLSALHINGGTDVNGNRITMKMCGKSYIPASVCKGIVRENFSKLWNQMTWRDDTKCTGSDLEDRSCSCIPCRMFGKAGFQRSRIYFDHLETEQNLQYLMRSNVSIDRHSRKSVDEALVFTEVIEPMARNTDYKLEPTVFQGNITVYYPPELDKLQQQQIEAVFVQAVKMMDYVGLGKSRGLGFIEVSINAPDGGWICEKE